jgi:lipoyl-dependent peroxiredoxin
MTPLYTATATATSGREGKVFSDDETIDLPLSMPKGLGGPGTPKTTNPEQLFAAGYSACFGSALKLVAGKQKLDASKTTITAKVSIGSDGGGFGLAVELIGADPAMPKEQLHSLMEAAHQVCPYSKATRGNIDVKLSVA